MKAYDKAIRFIFSAFPEVNQTPRFDSLLSLHSTLPREFQSWHACARFIAFHAAVFFGESEVLETNTSLHQLCALPLDILLDQGQVTRFKQNSQRLFENLVVKVKRQNMIYDSDSKVNYE